MGKELCQALRTAHSATLWLDWRTLLPMSMPTGQKNSNAAATAMAIRATPTQRPPCSPAGVPKDDGIRPKIKERVQVRDREETRR